MILTEVPALYRHFRKSNQEEIRELSADEAESLLPELAAGSMRPKIEAAIDFARTGGETLITSFDALAEALEGRAGTLVSTSARLLQRDHVRCLAPDRSRKGRGSAACGVV